MHRLLSAIAAVCLIAFSTGLRAEEPARSAQRAFERLSSLVGSWEGRLENGQTHGVSYHLTAGDSVLVETWALGPGRESMTLYHLDGDALIATHYCVQSNQPRLELATAAGDEFRFAFRDGTNLQAAEQSHQHAFWLKLHGRDAFVRSETYVENGAAPTAIASAVPGAAISYTRRAAPGAPN